MVCIAELFAFCDLHASRWRQRRQAALDGFEATLFAAIVYPRFYDRQGFPIPSESDDPIKACLTWARMREASDCRVASDVLPDGSRLSTVWLGHDHGFGGPPLIFETMRFGAALATLVLPTGGEQDYYPSLEFPDPETGEMTEQLRYTTEEEALAAHHAIVRQIVRREGH